MENIKNLHIIKEVVVTRSTVKDELLYLVSLFIMLYKVMR